MPIYRSLRFRPPRRLTALVAGLGAAAFLAVPASAATAHSGSASTQPGVSAGPRDNRICPFHFAWPLVTRYPRQADPQASYQYYLLQLPRNARNVGYEITGPAPYASWWSWTTVDDKVVAFSVKSDSAINPDRGNVNPFMDRSVPLLSPNRSYHIWIFPGQAIPPGPAFSTGSEVLPSLRLNPFVLRAQREQANGAGNVMVFDAGSTFVGFGARVYSAYPGYDRAGAGGPTHTPYPVIRSFNLTTGLPVNCVSQNLWPDSLVSNPSDLATAGFTNDTNDTPILHAAGLSGAEITAAGPGPLFAYPPKPVRQLVQGFRAPLATMPGADVPAVPPPDGCGGYLQFRLLPNQIALIRVPRVPTVFDNTNLTGQSTLGHQQFNSDTFSFNVYGTSPAFWLPGSPFSSGVNDTSGLIEDRTGGATFLVWPVNMPAGQRNRLFAQSRQLGWNIVRGSTQGIFAADQLIIRTKGLEKDYPHGISPTNAGPGAPCGQDILGVPASAGGTGPEFRDYPATYTDASGVSHPLYASPETMGPAAPQGVQCQPAEFFSGRCLARLKQYISQSGGSYFAPPPA